MKWIRLPVCSMNRAFEQWVALYNKKVSDKFKRDERFTLFYLPEKGFAEIADTGKIIVVNQVCGEFKFWRGVTEKIARQLGRSHAVTFFYRHVLPFMRLAGLEIIRSEKTKFGDSWVFEDKHTGQKGRASPTDDGSYFISWEVTTDGV